MGDTLGHVQRPGPPPRCRRRDERWSPRLHAAELRARRIAHRDSSLAPRAGRPSRAYYRLPAGERRNSEGRTLGAATTEDRRDPRREARVFCSSGIAAATDEAPRGSGRRAMTITKGAPAKPPSPTARTEPRPGRRNVERGGGRAGPQVDARRRPAAATGRGSVRTSSARRSSGRASTSSSAIPAASSCRSTTSSATIPSSATSSSATSRAAPTPPTATPASPAASASAWARPARARPTSSPASAPRSSTPSRSSRSPATSRARSSARTRSRRSTSTASRCR